MSAGKIHLYLEEHMVCEGKLGLETNGFVARKYLGTYPCMEMHMDKAENKFKHLAYWNPLRAFILTWHFNKPVLIKNSKESK